MPKVVSPGNNLKSDAKYIYKPPQKSLCFGQVYTLFFTPLSTHPIRWKNWLSSVGYNQNNDNKLLKKNKH